MKTKEALLLVLGLAGENALTEQEARENDLIKEYDRQTEALAIVEKLAALID